MLKIFLFLLGLVVSKAILAILIKLGPWEEHLCKIVLHLGQWFMMKCHLKKKFKHNGQRLIKTSPSSMKCSSELKKVFIEPSHEQICLWGFANNRGADQP